MSVHVRGCTGHVERERVAGFYTVLCPVYIFIVYNNLYVDLYQLSLKIVASLNVQSQAQVHAARSQASQPLCHNLQQVSRHDLAFEVVLYAVVKIKYILKPWIHLSITYSPGTDWGEKTILTICFCFVFVIVFIFFIFKSVNNAPDYISGQSYMYIFLNFI